MSFLALALAASCQAAPLVVPAVEQREAEYRLRAWLELDDTLQAKLGQLEAQHAAPFADPGLRDSVSDAPSAGDLRRRIEQAQTDKRRQLAARLPGMSAPDIRGCPTLGDCAQPPLALDVDDPEHLRAALRALLRPWMLLAQARGRKLRVEPSEKADQLVRLESPALGVKDAAVLVRARPEGGYHLWLDRAFELAAVYGRERDAALR